MKKYIIVVIYLISFNIISQVNLQLDEEYVEGRLIKTLEIENVEVTTSLRSRCYY